ncbi:polymorphic toxin-type HINT domain-containing protein [Streptomyces sp. NPDC093261]|uniref:polymorphic toxin-type HINT domain-containing protein n=1 Tax=Streptomyces sp. NPDC093261 TaxID=3366037 RepID=UPI0037FE07A7
MRIGDVVLATDPESGRTEAHTVTHTIYTPDDTDFADITIDAGAARITATQHHPFWSPSAHRWIDAGTLAPGQTLRTSGGKTVTIVHVHRYHRLHSAYNLTIDSFHTYYVPAGRTPVLVHNSMEECSDAAFQTVLHNEQEILDGKASHIIPGMDPRTPEGADALARYVDHIFSTPGTPLLNGAGEAWYDAERGVYIFRGGNPDPPSGSVFRAPPEYFTTKTGVQIEK